MRLLCVAMLLSACSDENWKPYTAERAYLECQFQQICAASNDGLDCETYIDQYTPRASPCVRFDDFYADACLDQMEMLLSEVRSDPSVCPTASIDRTPACGQAFVRSSGGACAQVE